MSDAANNVWVGWVVREVVPNPEHDPTKRLKATLKKRHTAEEWVVERVREEAPHLLTGTPDAPPDAQWVKELMAKIDTMRGNQHRWRRNFLLRALNRGARELGWPTFPYAPVVTLRQPSSRLNAATFPLIKRFRRLRDAFQQRLPDAFVAPEAEPESLRQGRILLSAVLFGGLASRPRLTAVSSTELARYAAYRDYLWLEWQDGDDKVLGDWQRWLPDPLTAVLLVRAHACGTKRLLPLGISARQTLWPTIAQAIAGLGLPSEDQPSSIRELLDWASAWLYRYLPPFLAHYSTGRLDTAALPPHAMARLLVGKPVAVPDTSSLSVEVDGDRRRPTYRSAPPQLGDLDGTATDLRRILRGQLNGHTGKRHRTRNVRLIREALQEFGEREDLPPIIQLLTDWVEQRIGRDAAVTVCLSQLEAIDRLLTERIGLDDPLAYAPDRLRAVYLDVIETSVSGKRHNLRVASLASLHRFLQRHHAAAEMDSDLFAEVPEDGGVNANCFSLPDTRAILEQLAPQWSRFNRRIAKAHQVALLFSVRCGLRRGEIARARLADVQGVKTPSLVLRERKDEALKSRHAERVVPLDALLDEGELDLVLAYVADVKRAAETQQEAILLDEVMLFPRDEDMSKELPEQTLFGPIKEAIHAVTGDTTLDIHHGRHSAITAILLGLLEDVIPGCSVIIGDPAPTNRRQKLQAILLGREGLSRQHLWAISLLAGHASPEMTMGNYVHLCDWLLRCALDQVQGELFSQEFMAEHLGMTSSRCQAAFSRLGIKPGSTFAVILESVEGMVRLKPTLTAGSAIAPAGSTTTIPVGGLVPDGPVASRPGVASRDGTGLSAIHLLQLLDDIDALIQQTTGDRADTRHLPRGTTVNSLARRHEVSPEAANGLWDIAQTLSRIAESRPGYRSKRGNDAGTQPPVAFHGQRIEFPLPRVRFPRSGVERTLTVKIYEALMGAWQADPDGVARWLLSHWRHADFETPTLRFESPAVAKSWMQFLLGLQVRSVPVILTKQLVLTHLPNGARDAIKATGQRRAWVKQLQVEDEGIQEGKPSKKRPGENGNGLVHVAIAYETPVSRAWAAAKEKHGVSQSKPRLGSVAINAAAYAMLLQVLSEEITMATAGAAADTVIENPPPQEIGSEPTEAAPHG